MRHSLSIIMGGVALALSSQPAFARNIVLTNDDGLTSNVVALYEALVAAGHDVIVSVPCTNQSGMGAALGLARPLAPLSEPCLNDAAKAGDPGAGPMTREGLAKGDFYYVNSTPVMALLHGLDVAAMARWGKAPDLVLSGPNEGQNVGAIILSSGTVSNAQVAAVRGLPAIALSAGGNTEGESLDNPLSDDVARRTLELIAALDARAGDGRLLPEGLALNVNFPDEPATAGWRLSRIGTYNAYALTFTMNMAANASPQIKAMAEARGQAIPELPGLGFGFNTAAPTPEQMDDESVVYRTHIAVSPMQAGYEYRADAAQFVRWQLGKLFAQPAE